METVVNDLQKPEVSRRTCAVNIIYVKAKLQSTLNSPIASYRKLITLATCN